MNLQITHCRLGQQVLIAQVPQVFTIYLPGQTQQIKDICS